MDRQNRELAYDLEVRCCGDLWRVRRELELVKTVEQTFGAIQPLSRRLAACEVTIGDLALLVHTLLKGHQDAPAKADIALWLFESGVHNTSRLLAAEVLTLIMGNDALAEYERLRAAGRAPESEAPAEARPFGRTAA